jgi:hypothetical protein
MDYASAPRRVRLRELGCVDSTTRMADQNDRIEFKRIEHPRYVGDAVSCDGWLRACRGTDSAARNPNDAE